MVAKKVRVPKWLSDAGEHNYPAAESYLTLIYTGKRAAKLVTQLRAARIARFKAKDIFRASRLSLLGISNSRCKIVE